LKDEKKNLDKVHRELDIETKKKEYEKQEKQNEVKDQYKLHMLKNSVYILIKN